MQRKSLRYLLIAMAVAVGIVLTRPGKNGTAPSAPRDFPAIRQSGVLRAVTEYNAVSYHVSPDSISGFDYELILAFAKAQGLRAEVSPEMEFEKRMEGITSGKYDVLAVGTVVNAQLKDTILFTHPLLRSKQILVQRKKESATDSTYYIENQLQLAHKRLHVIKGSPALLRIHNLIDEIADTIYVEEVEQYGAEQLLAMVSEGDIDYAVCDENIARKSIGLYPNLDIRTDIGFSQLYAWGVSKHSTELLDSLNGWIDRFVKSKEYRQLYYKYYKTDKS